MARLKRLWGELSGTLWFVPTIMVVMSAVLGVGLVELSALVDPEVLRHYPRLFGASAEGARGMLTAIAGSMITVAGVTFSITMVAVTQASAQYTPRILRNFLRDRPSQVVLGGLTGVFMYCLVVLRTIRGGDDYNFVPSVAVLAGFVFAGIGIGLLIYFIHHISSALQAGSIIERVARDTSAAVTRCFVAPASGQVTGVYPPPPQPPGGWHRVPATKTGYVLHVDVDSLVALARSLGTIVRMERGAGEFVLERSPLVSLAGGRWSTPDVTRRVNAAFSIGPHRTVDQDAEFGARQIADIAVKALSPGINDPTTAVTCLHYLTWILADAAAREEAAPVRAEGGELRLIGRFGTFAGLVETGLGGIRRYSGGHVEVLSTLVKSLRTIGDATNRGDRRLLLASHLDQVEATIAASVAGADDRARLLDMSRQTRELLTSSPSRSGN